jgi:hypothetical protein
MEVLRKACGPSPHIVLEKETQDTVYSIHSQSSSLATPTNDDELSAMFGLAPGAIPVISSLDADLRAAFDACVSGDTQRDDTADGTMGGDAQSVGNIYGAHLPHSPPVEDEMTEPGDPDDDDARPLVMSPNAERAGSPTTPVGMQQVAVPMEASPHPETGTAAVPAMAAGASQPVLPAAPDSRAELTSEAELPAPTGIAGAVSALPQAFIKTGPAVNSNGAEHSAYLAFCRECKTVGKLLGSTATDSKAPVPHQGHLAPTSHGYPFGPNRARAFP